MSTVAIEKKSPDRYPPVTSKSHPAMNAASAPDIDIQANIVP